AARDQIGLVANSRQLVAHAGKAERVNRALVGLEVIGAAGHRFAGLGIFVGNRAPAKTPAEGFIFSVHVAGQEMHPLLLIAARKIGDRQTFVKRFFANSQEAIVAVAINKFRVLMN